MKKIILYIFLLILHVSSYAQNHYVDSLLNWLEVHPQEDTDRVINTHRLSYRLSEIDASKAWKYARETEILARKIKFEKGNCLANINYAILEAVEGNFERSADYYLEAIKIAESIKYTRGLSISYNNIGENYFRLKDYNKATEYSKKAFILNRSINENRGQAINLEMLGSINFSIKNYEKAFAYWKQGMEFASKTKDENIYSQLNADLGKYYSMKGDWKNAYKYLHIADSVASKNEELYYQIMAYKAYSEAYFKQKKHDSSLLYLHKALSGSISLGNKNEEFDIYNLLALEFEQHKNFDSGIYYLRKHLDLGTKLLSEKNLAHLNFIQTQYETKAKEEENNALKIITQHQDRKLNEKNWLLIASLIVLFLACLSIFLVYRVLQNNKHNQALEEQHKTAEFKHQVAELEVMALRSQMNPHFLFNSLNSIRNFIIKNEPKLASDYLANFAKLMRKILDASQQSKIVLEDEVEMLSIYIDIELMRFSNRFNYSIHVDDELKNIGILIPSMVLQPFIENAIWHGLLNKEDDEGAKLEISFKEVAENDDEIICEIVDNGIGRVKSESIKSNFQIHKSKGINITKERLIKLSKKNIANPIEIIDLYDHEGNANGTKVILRLPIL